MAGRGGDGFMFDLKFRLADGTDLGPWRYSYSSTIAAVKEDIVAQWPPDRENGPTSARQVRLIHSGRILQNRKTLARSRLRRSQPPGEVITMHLVVLTPELADSSERSQNETMEQPGCSGRVM